MGRWLGAAVGKMSLTEGKRIGFNRVLKFGLAGPIVFDMFLYGKGERPKAIARDLGIFALTMGFRNPFRQGLYAAALSMLPMFPELGRAVTQGFRSSLAARSSVAVPFSHSTTNMDQAYATLQFAKQRMGQAYGALAGSEATMFAARYMQR